MNEHKNAITIRTTFEDADGFPVRSVSEIHYFNELVEARAFYNMILGDKRRLVTKNANKCTDGTHCELIIDLQTLDGRGKWKLVKRSLEDFYRE